MSSFLYLFLRQLLQWEVISIPFLESFAVDSAISKFNGQVQTEKELEPWQSEDTSCGDLGLGEGNEVRRLFVFPPGTKPKP